MKTKTAHGDAHRVLFRATPTAAAFRMLLLLSVAPPGVRLCSGTSEFEYADFDWAPSSVDDPRSAPAPATLVASSVDPLTGLRTDTFLKPLGTLTPGEVMNTQ